MAEKFSLSQQGESLVMKRIFEKIERERNENEFTRTEVLERADDLDKVRLKNRFNLNQSRDLRIIENYSTQNKGESYIKRIKELNEPRLQDTQNGFKN
jgi:hypothetical protein